MAVNVKYNVKYVVPDDKSTRRGCLHHCKSEVYHLGYVLLYVLDTCPREGEACRADNEIFLFSKTNVREESSPTTVFFLFC